MWTSKGRSGYGDSTIGGDYDSWDGISPNGRQYRNEATMETRDLSGADYWHLRKQNRPTEEIPAHLHMLNKDKANINAYADKEIIKKSKVPLVNKILPQKVRVDNLTQQMRDLVAEFKQGIHTQAEYDMYIDILASKRDRAEILLKKAMSQKPVRDDEYYEEFNINSHETPTSTSHKGNEVERKNSWVKLRINVPKDLIIFSAASFGFFGLMLLILK